MNVFIIGTVYPSGLQNDLSGNSSNCLKSSIILDHTQDVSKDSLSISFRPVLPLLIIVAKINDPEVVIHR